MDYVILALISAGSGIGSYIGLMYLIDKFKVNLNKTVLTVTTGE